jgi:hypothetical protein
MKSAFSKFLGLPFLILGTTCCTNLSPKYGLTVLRGTGDTDLYLKREVRGLNYDVVVLSTNKDHCAAPNADSEFIFASDPLPIYYSFDGNTLKLFLTSLVAQPSEFRSSVKVVQTHLSPSEFAEIQKNFRERGLERLDIPIDNKLRCR